jgi:protein-S-isoprenylcysteine O-methyltransferase Ste14
MDRLTSAEGSLALAISALLLVLGYRFARPARGRDWGAVASYATALVVGLLGARGLLPGTAPASPGPALRLGGAALLLGGLLLAGAAARARAATAPGALVVIGPYARLRHPLPAGLALVVAGHLLRGPSFPGVVAALAALAVLASAAAAEDADARRAFGDAWERWAARTPALLPLPRRRA